ncbi:hypothetical protein B0T22DRAFT_137597 [Podospora appendiculata]|uniref:Secreted protein n=1 Tax=Podospora appendiculata TaxID=314037 RepID=A0AAE0X8D3_9PEZI|nr:hypothetical protein B0T22DRAFT_137597 [Podospora appendiculata]
MHWPGTVFYFLLGFLFFFFLFSVLTSDGSNWETANPLCLVCLPSTTRIRSSACMGARRAMREQGGCLSQWKKSKTPAYHRPRFPNPSSAAVADFQVVEAPVVPSFQVSIEVSIRRRGRRPNKTLTRCCVGKVLLRTWGKKA